MFDAKRFLVENFRTPAEAVGMFTAHGQFPPPKEDAVRKWFTRGSIPADWLVLAFAVLRQRTGRIVDGHEYLMRDGGTPRLEASVLD